MGVLAGIIGKKSKKRRTHHGSKHRLADRKGKKTHLAKRRRSGENTTDPAFSSKRGTILELGIRNIT